MAGIDVVFGIVALGVTHALVADRFGSAAGDLAGAVAFGIGFVFIVVGRSELFTENFLVPVAGVDRRSRRSWLDLLQLWLLSPLFNLVGGAILVVIVTTHGVLPDGTGGALRSLAERTDENGAVAAAASAVAAGALVTLMTWLVEGADSMGVRIVTAWIAGSLLALGMFNHVIVVTLELFIGIRYGADVGYGDLFSNLAIALVGNLVGGILLVTLTRFGQAHAIRTG